MGNQIEKLEALVIQAEADITDIAAEKDLLYFKSKYLGKKGALFQVLKSLKDASLEDKKNIGQLANQSKSRLTELLTAKEQELKEKERRKKLEKEWIDISLRESNLEQGLVAGGYHPLIKLQRELEDVFTSMGFEILDGPHIEEERYNFTALNVPADHPARDMQDTLWFRDRNHLLRTQTSPIQIRGMEKLRPPFKIVGPGKVFRRERIDASHECVFHQLEGMMVDEGITLGNLIHFSHVFFTEMLQREVKLRTRPSYFPFVEPGIEVDVICSVCNGEGCSVCSQSGWVEIMGAGMVHPNVLKAGNIDPQKYSGFAFGPGIDRLLMMRYGINDIRLLHSGNLNFLSQFKSF